MAEAGCACPIRQGRRNRCQSRPAHPQRIHEDARRLTELSTDLGVGLLQASLLLLSFLGVLWTVSGALEFSICGVSLTIPGYMVWCAVLYAASGSWLTWPVGRPLVTINPLRYQRESELRFALFEASQHMQRPAELRGEERQKGKLGLGLEKVLAIARGIVDTTAKLTWVTAGYGWVSIVAPIVIAAYFSTKLSFGELMSWLAHSIRLANHCAGSSTTLRCSLNGVPRSSESLSSAKCCRRPKTAVNRKTRLFNSGTSPIYGSSRMAPG